MNQEYKIKELEKRIKELEQTQKEMGVVVKLSAFHITESLNQKNGVV